MTCPTCEGRGEVEVCKPGCRIAWCGNNPNCESRWETCPDCGGTGEDGAAELGADLIAPGLEERGGAFTGALRGEPLTGAHKSEALRAHAAAHDIDLSQSHAFGDAFGDLPLLGRLFRSTGQSAQKRNLLIFVTANLVNPGGALKKHGPQRGPAGALYPNPATVTPGSGEPRLR